MEEEKRLDQDYFLSKYNLRQTFEKAGVAWKTLQDIYEDYKKNRYSQMQDLAKQLVVDLELEKKKIWDDEPGKRMLLQDIHVIYGRAKDPEHLIEKIIRKIGNEDSQKYNEINVVNYFDILRDLIGVRIIVIKKEGWKAAHDLLCSLFKTFYDHTPKAYVCYGDRKIFDERSIDVDYTVKGYRSQHYVVQYEGHYAEVQVRTLAEEVYGEFDHRVRYPYNKDNKFLLRYTNMISRSISELDDMISTCMQLDEEMLEKLNQKFEKDSYVDWAKEQGGSQSFTEEEQISLIKNGDINDIIRNKLL